MIFCYGVVISKIFSMYEIISMTFYLRTFNVDKFLKMNKKIDDVNTMIVYVFVCNMNDFYKKDRYLQKS